MKILRGKIHGHTIELDEEPGLPAGQEVDVTLKLVTASTECGDGLQRAFGTWSEDTEELDEFLDWNRQQRKVSRRTAIFAT